MTIKTKKPKRGEIDQKQFVFSAEVIEDIMQKTSMGFQLPRYMNPWFMNQTGVRKPGCVYGWTDYELEEFAKCKMDIHYFANNYCKIKVEDGTIKQMKLRKYQYKVLDVYSKNRFVINMSSRQVGKCLDKNTSICISYDGGITHEIVSFEELIKRYNLIFDENDIPSFNGDLINKIYLNKTINNLDVLTITGWTKVTELNITKKMSTFKIETESGSFLEGADFHLIMTKDSGWKTLDQLQIDELVIIGNKFEKITNITFNEQVKELYDLTTDSGDYLTSGNDNRNIEDFINSSFLSHNTVTASITILHYCIFNSNKGVMIVANKNETVIEIIDKIKNIYKLLPFFLKPGLINWNSKAVVFDNGCRIKSQARSKEPAIGFSIDFLYVDEFAHIPSSIARHYYKAVVPTVSAINNSKILITSTPNGTNLFKELVEGAELSEGHPDKNQYKCIRVYWYEVAGRLDPKFYPIDMELRRRKITFEEIIKDLTSQGLKATIEKEQSDTGEIKLIRVDYENGKWPIESVREIKIRGVNFAQYGTVTNWKETETKLIGGEEHFNQEYGIQFISGSKRILNTKTAVRLEQRKTQYIWENIEPLNKLQFTYDELKWSPEFVHSTRLKQYWVGSIDTSEGLGQDASVINLFRLYLRDAEWLKNNKIKNVYEAFYLKQTGIYHHNRLHPTELADLVYSLFFEYLDPERCKIVLELNGPGGRLLDALPKCLDQNNEFGEYIFIRYQHNVNNKFKHPGLKVSGGNKKDMVKTYINAIESDRIWIDEVNTYLEMENFIKVETKAGNITYKADSGHDDRVMTIVNGSTIFETREWQNLCSSMYKELEKIEQINIDAALDLEYNPKAMGYKSLSGALRSSRNGITKARFRKNFKRN